MHKENKWPTGCASMLHLEKGGLPKTRAGGRRKGCEFRKAAEVEAARLLMESWVGRSGAVSKDEIKAARFAGR